MHLREHLVQRDAVHQRGAVDDVEQVGQGVGDAVDVAGPRGGLVLLELLADHRRALRPGRRRHRRRWRLDPHRVVELPHRPGGPARPAAGGQRPRHQSDHLGGVAADVAQRQPPGVGRGAVHLQHARFRCVVGDRALVDQPERVVVLQHAVGRDPLVVQRVHVQDPPDLDVETGLLVHLAGDRVGRVLAVVDTAAGQRPGARPGRDVGEQREQHLLAVRPLAQHQRVGRDPLPAHRLPVRTARRLRLRAHVPRLCRRRTRQGRPSRKESRPWRRCGAATGRCPVVRQLRNDPKSKSSSATDCPVGWPKS